MRTSSRMVGGAKVLAACALGAALATGCLGCAPQGSASSSAAASASSSTSSSAQASSSSSAAQSADDMTIAVQLSEEVTKATDVDTPLQFADEQIDVVAPDGATALEVLKATGREVKTDDSGEQVIAIGGLENGDAGEGSCWIYEVNGAEQHESAAAFTLEDGDTLAWKFVRTA